MKRWILNSLAVAILLVPLMSSKAWAVLVTVDPDNFPGSPPTDISSAVPGVTFANAGGPLYAADWTTARGNVFARPDLNLGFYLLGDPTEVFRARFDSPTDFVSILTTTSGFLNNSQIRAYDVNGNFLTGLVSSGTTSGDVSITITRSKPDISYVVGGSTNELTATVIDRFTFNLVPVPIPITGSGTLIASLLILGGLGCAVRNQVFLRGKK